ncbi:MAG: valine--pyruvate transaminase [Pseudohongiellaceae bacterium]
MTRRLSRFGQKFTAASGIVNLMDDLGSALRENPGMLMLGGGTPARIEVAELMYRKHLQRLLADAESAWQLLGRYQGPLGDDAVRERLAETLVQHYGWAVTRDHITVTNGGQSAFGILANLLAGDMPDGSQRRVHFPLLPEYLGYADAGFTADFFSGTRPVVQLLPGRRFKYHVDFGRLQVDSSVGALCVSRPTNPSGNVLTVAELDELDRRTRVLGIPLIVDAAYGLPFPGLHFCDSPAWWSDNSILMLSLSKVGLPGLRSGFLVGPPDLIEAFSRANTILNLASGNVGSMLAASLLESGDLLQLGREVLQPWYRAKAALAEAVLLDALRDIPCHLHVAEGAFFLWLWLPDLPVSTTELYRLLKQAGVLVIPGDAAFPGLQEDWPHSRECLRLSFAVPEATLQQAAAIISRVLRGLYRL